jgi:hypothetical protein
MLELCEKDRVVGDPGKPEVASPAFHTARARAVIQKVLEDSNWATRQAAKDNGRALGFGFTVTTPSTG